MAHRMSNGLERAAREAATALPHEAPELLLFQHPLDRTSDHFSLSLHAEHTFGTAQRLGLDEERLPDQRSGARHRSMTSMLQHSIGIRRLRYRHMRDRLTSSPWLMAMLMMCVLLRVR